MPRVKHRSSRRVSPPKDSDFDHEISLVDNAPSTPSTSREGEISSRGTDSAAVGPSSPRREPPNDSAAVEPPQNGHVAPSATKPTPDASVRGRSLSPARGRPVIHVDGPTPQPETEQPEAEPPMTADSMTRPKPRPKPKTPESAIDILYENQRGGFLCGMPLFSSMALGNLDPPAWTNFAHRPSPTDIRTAQVPDPSWEWAWPDWKINHDDGVDEEGWEYSFMFSKKFSWHKARWWNSFVRRRAWIRKRVKKNAGYAPQDPGMLNLEYFTVRASVELDRSPSRDGVASKRGSRMSTSTANGADPPADIVHVDDLLHVLRASRIDREKIDALDNYLDHAEDDLAGLQDVMHEIMSLFVFQASRRVLLTKLTEVYDRAVTERDEGKGKNTTAGDAASGAVDLEKRATNLAAALQHADEEVKRLEYWSDVRGMVQEGDTKGAVDEGQGWNADWQGLDRSGPKAPSPPTPKETETGDQ